MGKGSGRSKPSDKGVEAGGKRSQKIFFRASVWFKIKIGWVEAVPLQSMQVTLSPMTTKQWQQARKMG